MFKELFEQPANAEKEEISDEETKLIEAEKRLQELMNRATKTLERAEANKLISGTDAERLHILLKQVAEEISAEDSVDIDEALFRLEVLGNRLKLPGDKEEEIKLTLEGLEKWAQEKAAQKSQGKNNGTRKRKGNFFFSRKRGLGNDNHESSNP